ncbi:hypothetical protein SFR_6975 (plasmid) [Streptomyces sp. FR-008]|nr:hypothetical protein SFR_6975 [Streptomyces sp. FR-008]
MISRWLSEHPRGCGADGGRVGHQGLAAGASPRVRGRLSFGS